MTTAHSELLDNNGLCEHNACRNPREAQRTYPLQLGGFHANGGVGWGTIWLCQGCAERRHEKPRIDIPVAHRWFRITADADRPEIHCDPADLAALETAKAVIAKLNQYEQPPSGPRHHNTVAAPFTPMPLRVTLRNTHQVQRDPSPDARLGDILIESFRRACSRGDALGLVLHLMEQAGLTMAEVEAGAALLRDARVRADTLVRSGRPPSSWTAEESALVLTLGPGNDAPSPLAPTGDR